MIQDRLDRSSIDPGLSGSIHNSIQGQVGTSTLYSKFVCEVLKS